MNRFKQSVLGAVAAALVVAGPVAAEGVSFNVGAVSLYKLRGVDQDAKNKSWRPAIQGGVDYDFGNGFYVGNWNSTGKFGASDLELDFYGGYKGELSGGVGYDVGAIRYHYAGDKTFGNSSEIYGGLAYGPVGFKIYRGLTTGVNKQDLYYALSYEQPVSEQLTFKAALGYTNYDDPTKQSKTDYSLGVAYAMDDSLTLSAMLQGASDKNTVTDGSRDNRLVLGIGKAF